MTQTATLSHFDLLPNVSVEVDAGARRGLDVQASSVRSRAFGSSDAPEAVQTERARPEYRSWLQKGLNGVCPVSECQRAPAPPWGNPT